MPSAPAGFSSNARRRVRRRGISLLEVLISIFVFLVGILGVAALLPLANHLATRGAIADRAGELGRRAHREFRIRGMNRSRTIGKDMAGDPFVVATNWYDPNQNSPPPPPPPLAPGGPINATQNVVRLIPGQSYAIDPRFVAINGITPVSGTDSTLFPYPKAFPYAPNTVIAMRRVSLGSTQLQGATLEGTQIDSLHAEEIFMSQDDLSIFVPDDGESPPVQMDTTGYDPGSGQIYPWTDIVTAGGTPTKRQSDGRFSWMATLVPPVNSSSLSDLYTLSIVVFYQRDPSMSRDNLNERVVGVQLIGGGDVTLKLPDSTADAEQILGVKPGRWLMLRQYKPPNDFSVGTFRWYRVIAADPEVYDNGSGDLARDVTLVGPDLNPVLQTQATIVEGVVAVYEKTIRLDTSSLWSN